MAIKPTGGASTSSTHWLSSSELLHTKQQRLINTSQQPSQLHFRSNFDVVFGKHFTVDIKGRSIPLLLVVSENETPNFEHRTKATKLVNVLQYHYGPFVCDVFGISAHNLIETLLRIDVIATTATFHHDLRFHVEQILIHRNSTLQLLYFDGAGAVEVLNEVLRSEPLALRAYLFNRDSHTSASFRVADGAAAALQLRWADFRGNTRIANLGENNTPLMLHARTNMVQNTSPGHLFVIVDSSLQPTSNGTTDARGCVCSSNDESMQQQCMATSNASPALTSADYYTSQLQLDRIVAMYLVLPSVQSAANTAIISTNIAQHKPQLHNMHLLLDITPSCRLTHTSKSTALNPTSAAVDTVSDDNNGMRCVTDLLSTYWLHQRASQINVFRWAVPDVHSAFNQHHRRYHDQPQHPLFKRFMLSAELRTRILANYLSLRRDHLPTHEPLISAVFNQQDSATQFLPLHPSDWQDAQEEVFAALAEWFAVDSTAVKQMFELTGQYACREYTHGAIIRWHVDPVLSQPITAIVHVSRSSSDDTQTVQWPFELQLDDNNIEQIDFQEGEVLLFQSAKLPHARNTALNGNFYANAFMHFRPIFWPTLPAVQALL